MTKKTAVDKIKAACASGDLNALHFISKMTLATARRDKSIFHFAASKMADAAIEYVNAPGWPHHEIDLKNKTARAERLAR